MASLFRLVSSVVIVVLVFAHVAAAQSSMTTSPYDRVYMRSGNRLASGCGKCCRNACQLTYFNEGTIARQVADAYSGPIYCANTCQRLLPVCQRACSNAIAVNTVDTANGCGCTAPRLYPARALVACRRACRNALVPCRRRCNMKRTCPIFVRLELAWRASVNGTCSPVCRDRVPVTCG